MHRWKFDPVPLDRPSSSSSREGKNEKKTKKRGTVGYTGVEKDIGSDVTGKRGNQEEGIESNRKGG